METSIRIVDYHLKERIEGKNPKITLSRKNLLLIIMLFVIRVLTFTSLR